MTQTEPDGATVDVSDASFSKRRAVQQYACAG